jgi:DNA (cytosine-5)-methyltransferase 1
MLEAHVTGSGWEAPPAFVSLFSGAGGLDLGLEQAGWSCRYASDIDAAAVASLESNRGFDLGLGRRAFADSFIEHADIRALTAAIVFSKSGLRKGDISLLAGGPPCQSWSSAGHQHGFADPRGRLFGEFVRFADELDVRWLVLENVRGLLTARGAEGQPGSALAFIRRRLLIAGFQTAVTLLNAADYGVPQRRVRLLIFGFRAGDPPPLPLATHAKCPGLVPPKLKPWVTLGEALSALSPPRSDEVMRPTAKLAAELEGVRPGCGVKSPGKCERTRPGGHWGYKQGAFVADLAQSARTVTANSQQDWIIDPVFGLRRLCPRECAAIQSFPKSWYFHGSPAVQYKLIGNAVPPALAQSIGTALLGHVAAHKLGGNQRFDNLLPLPQPLLSAIDYTFKEERSNGASRRASPRRRVFRCLGVDTAWQ